MKKILIILAIIISSISTLTLVAPQPVMAAVESNPTCAKSFLGFPVWYRGLTVSSTDCNIKNPSDVKNFIWHIALNVIEIGLRLVGFAALYYILYGGFTFLTSNGSSDKVVKGKAMITNAVVGLIISIASVAIVMFISAIMG